MTGLETYFWLDDAPQPIIAAASVAGLTVSARAAPHSYLWDFGDGNDFYSNHSGRPWTEGRPGNIGHTYETRAYYTVGVEVIWRAEWRVGGGPWQPLGSFSTSGERGYPVRQIQSRLVSEDYRR